MSRLVAMLLVLLAVLLGACSRGREQRPDGAAAPTETPPEPVAASTPSATATPAAADSIPPEGTAWIRTPRRGPAALHP
jgi:hypothetical protein